MYKTILALLIMAPCAILASAETTTVAAKTAKVATEAAVFFTDKAHAILAALPALSLPAIDNVKLILCGSASMPLLSVALIKYLESGKSEEEKLSPRTRAAIIFAGFLGSIAIAQLLPATAIVTAPPAQA